MANFAEIDENNIVVRVLNVPDEQEHRGQEYLAEDCGLGGTWIQTSVNTYANKHRLDGTPLRKNYASVGYKYDETLDAFIPPQPFLSWYLDTENCIWLPPILPPEDAGPDKVYIWEEVGQFWKLSGN